MWGLLLLVIKELEPWSCRQNVGLDQNVEWKYHLDLYIEKIRSHNL